MVKDSYNRQNGKHASKQAIIIANEIAKEIGCKVIYGSPNISG